jgi:ribosomal protein L10
MFLLNAQAQRLATALSAVSRNLAVVLNQAAEKKSFSE